MNKAEAETVFTSGCPVIYPRRFDVAVTYGSTADSTAAMVSTTCVVPFVPVASWSRGGLWSNNYRIRTRGEVETGQGAENRNLWASLLGHHVMLGSVVSIKKDGRYFSRDRLLVV